MALLEPFYIVLSVPEVYQYINVLPAERTGLLLDTGGSTVTQAFICAVSEMALGTELSPERLDCVFGVFMFNIVSLSYSGP